MPISEHTPHPTQLLHLYDVFSKTVKDVKVDIQLVPLIDILHKRGILTYFCCQGNPCSGTTVADTEHLAHVMMRRDQNSMGLLCYLLANYPAFEDYTATLWEIQFDQNLEYGGDRMIWRFPNHEIDIVTEFLK